MIIVTLGIFNIIVAIFVDSTTTGAAARPQLPGRAGCCAARTGFNAGPS